MPAPIPDDKREAIAADVAAGGHGCRELARKHSVSPATIRKITAEIGQAGTAFARAQTKNATRAREADMAARRADLALGLLEDAEKLRTRAWEEYVVVVRQGDSTYREVLDMPPLAEVRQAYTAVGIAIDKHLALVKHDKGDASDHSRSMLARLMSGMQAAVASWGPEGEDTPAGVPEVAPEGEHGDGAR